MPLILEVWQYYFVVQYSTDIVSTLSTNGYDHHIIGWLTLDFSSVWQADRHRMQASCVFLDYRWLVSRTLFFAACNLHTSSDGSCLHDLAASSLKTTRDQFINLSDAGDGILRLWGSIPCLLLLWLLKSPEHQQAWYWLCRTDNIYSCCRVNFKDRQHLLLLQG